MWQHNCKNEGCIMMVGKGEECSWCGAREHDAVGLWSAIRPISEVLAEFRPSPITIHKSTGNY